MAQFPNEQTKSGAFKRQEDAFRDWVKRDGSTTYKPEPGRYHLYVSLACPWAHRTIILRKLKGLEEVIGMTVVDPVRDERGWAFREGPGHSEDPINGFKFLSEGVSRDRSELPRTSDRAGALGQENETRREQFRRRPAAHAQQRIRRLRHQRLRLLPG